MKNRNKLLWIIVLVLIIGVLVLLLFLKNTKEEKEKAIQLSVRNEMSTIIIALDMYKLDHGNYPSVKQGLSVLVENVIPESRRSYLPDKSYLTDFWGNNYIYRYPGENNTIEIISYGADGLPGGEGIEADLIFTNKGDFEN